MEEEALSLETVVVTAMGIKRKSETLTYSVQQVNGDDLTRVKDPNMINALEGKIAGVTITKSASDWVDLPKYLSAVSVRPMKMEIINHFM